MVAGVARSGTRASLQSRREGGGALAKRFSADCRRVVQTRRQVLADSTRVLHARRELRQQFLFAWWREPDLALPCRRRAVDDFRTPASARRRATPDAFGCSGEERSADTGSKSAPAGIRERTCAVRLLKSSGVTVTA